MAIFRTWGIPVFLMTSLPVWVGLFLVTVMAAPMNSRFCELWSLERFDWLNFWLNFFVRVRGVRAQKKKKKKICSLLLRKKFATPKIRFSILK